MQNNNPADRGNTGQFDAVEALQEIDQNGPVTDSVRLDGVSTEDIPRHTPSHNRMFPFSRRKATVVSSVITVIVLLLTIATMVYQVRQQKPDEISSQKAIQSQDLNLQEVSLGGLPSELQGAEESLLVNGNVSVRGNLKVVDGSFSSIIENQGLTGNQQYKLPDASGVFCLDSNNCKFVTQDQLTQLQAQLPVQGLADNSIQSLSAGSSNLVFTNTGNGNIQVTDTTASESKVNSINNQSGGLLLQGTPNQVTVNSGNGTFTVSTPQDINTGATPTFAGMVLTGLNCTVNANGGSITTDAAGRLVCSDDDGGSGSAITGGGTAGSIPVFSSGQVIANSIISQAGGTVSIGGSLSLSNALGVGSGGTGNVSFTNNGMLYGNGSGAVLATAAPLAGQILLGNGSGVPAFASLSGDIALTSTGLATIQTDSVALGVDTTGNYVNSVSAGNGVSVSGGAGEGSSNSISVIYGNSANTSVQGNTALTCPTGTGNLTGGGSLITLGNGGICGNLTVVNNPTFSGVLAVQGNSITIGTATQQGSLLLNDGSSNTGSIQTDPLAQNTIYTLPDPGSANASICLSSGNCLGGGDGGANVSLSNLSGVALNTSLLPGAANIDLGSSASPFRDLYIGGTASNNFRITGTAAAARVYTLPDVGASAIFCLSTGNCAGAGTSITGSGTAGRIAKFDASQNIVNSIITESGTVVTVSGTLAATTLQGDGAGVTNINASNVASGTLSDLRLSPNVSLLGQIIGLAELDANAVDGSKIIDGSVTNTDLANSSISVNAGGGLINGGSINLGGSATLNVGAGDGILVNADNIAVDTTVCRTSGNCAGVGGTGNITGSGTAGSIAKFDANRNVVNSLISESGAAVTISGTVSATSFSGNGASLAALNADNITSGTLSNLRLNSNVSLLGQTIESAEITDGTIAGTDIAANAVALGTQTTGNYQTFTTAGDGISVSGAAGEGSTPTVAVDSTVCRDTGNCAGVGGTGDVLQGGNTVASAMTIGTNNAFAFNLETAGVTRISIGTTGLINLGAYNCSTFGNGGALTTDASGNLICTADDGGAGSAITGSGTAGRIAKFDSSQNIVNSIMTEAGTTITVGGTLSATNLQGAGSGITDLNGSNIATGTVAVARGGTGAGSFTANGVLYGNGASAIGSTAAGTTGQCLLATTGGAPSFGTCTGAGGVASIDGLTGAVNVNNATGSAGVITIDDASTLAKGIASFAAADFDVTAGAVTLDAVVTKLGQTIESAEITDGTIAGTDIAANAVALGTQTTGNYQTFTTAGDGISVSGAAGEGSTPTVAVDSTVCRDTGNCAGVGGTGDVLQGGNTVASAMTIGTNNAFAFNLETAGVTRISIGTTGLINLGAYNCSTFGNGGALTTDASGNLICTADDGGAGSAITGSGTAGRIAKFDSSQNIVNSIMTEAGTTITVGGTLSATNLQGAGSGITDLNGSNIATGTVAVARGGTGAGSFTAGGVLYGNGASAIGSTAAGTTGQCLLATTGGAPSFGTCTGAGGVASIDGLTGAVNVNNATGSAGVITIDDASTLAKGIASFAAADFDVTAGAVTLDAVVTKLGQTIESAEITDGTIAGTDIAANAVALGTQTTGNYQTFTTAGDGISVSGAAGEGSTPTVAVDSTVCRDTGNCAGVGGTGDVLQGGNTVASAMTIGTNNAFAFNLETAGVTRISIGTTGLINLGAYNCSTFGNGGALTTDASGNLICTADDGGAGSAITGSGTAGRIAKFDSSQNIVNSIMTEAGTTITVGGTLSATNLQGAGSGITDLNGSNIATGTVAVARGGTGAGSFTAGGVLYGNGASAIGSTAAGTTGQCLLATTGGAPSFGTCTGAGGVASIDGLTGAVNVNNATGSAGVITIDDASTLAKGIASFAAADFDVTAGAVTLDAVVTKLGQTIESAEITDGTIAGTDIAANAVALGTQTTGNYQTFTTAGDGISVSGAAGEGSTPTVAVDSTVCRDTGNCAGVGGTGDVLQGGNTVASAMTIGTNNAFAFNLETAGVTRISIGTTGLINLGAYNCSTFGNGGALTTDASGNLICTADDGGAGSAITGSGTAGRIAKFDSSQNIVNSIMTEAGTTITVGGTLSATNLQGAGSGITDLNGSNIATGTVAVARGGTGAGSFTAGGVLYGNGASAIGSTAAGTTGQCLLATTGGAPSFGTCTGAGGVASIDGLTGAVNVNNATGSAGVITIDDASTLAKGIASFAAADFDVTAGAVTLDAVVTKLGSSISLTTEVTGTLPIANGGTNATTSQAAINNLSQLTTNGDLLYHNGTNSTRLPRGTTGECLTSTGTSLDWASCQPGGSGVTTVGTLDTGNGGVKVANGAFISGTSIYMQTADASFAGLMGTGDQTFAGNKTFNETVTLSHATALALGTNSVTVGGVTLQSTELSYLDGATSNIQTQITGKQAADLTLNSFAAYNTNGFIVQTGADSFTGRSIVAGSTKLSVTNGDGVAGNPSLDVVESNIAINNLSGTLAVAKGGTGAGSFTANGVLYGNGASAIGSTAAGTTGQCLLATTGGAPSFGTCTGAGGGVTSLDGLSGALTINNATGAGSVITIDDATTAVKGIASFAAADFDVTAGAVTLDATVTQLGNTIESAEITDGTIANSDLLNSSVNFGGVSVSLGASDLTPAFNLVDASGLNIVNGTSGTLTVARGGTGATTLTSGGILFGNGTGAITASSVLANGQLLIGDGTGAPTVATLTQGTGIIITNGAGSITVAVDSAAVCMSGFFCGGSDPGGATIALDNLSSVNINTSLLAGSTSIDLGSAAKPFRNLYVGGAATNNFQFTGTATAARTITIPNASGTICLVETGNCAGSGSGITGSGTLNTLAKFTGTGNTIGNSLLSESGSIVSLTGTMSATNFQGNGSGLTDLDAGDITTGTLAVGRGGTGAGSFTANGVLYGNGASAIGSTAAGTTGQCLLATTGGAPAWGTCTGAGSGVTSLDGLSGALTINNATGSGSVITIDDATTAVKGIASFAAADFDVTAGTVTLDATVTQLGNTFNGVSQLVQTTAAGALPALSGTNVTNLNGTNITSGTVGIAYGGTGITTTPTNGKLLIGNGTSYASANLTSADSTVVITNGAGTINLSAPGAGTCAACVSLQSTTPGSAQTGHINITGTIIAGSFSGNGSGLTNLDAGDITAGTLAIARGGTGITTTPTNGKLLIGNGTSYASANLTSADSTVVITNGAGTINLSAPGAGTCAACVSLQSTTPGSAQTGHINITGTIIAGSFSGNGSGLTQLNGTAISAGTVAATVGGTGQATYTVGDLLYASSTTALGKLASVTAGSCLKSNGVSAAPSWGTCGAAGVTTVGAIDTGNGGVKVANGAFISGSTIYLQTANASFPGLMGIGSQTFSGAKTFSGATTINNTAYININSAAAFKVENSAGNLNTLVVDTTSGRVGIGTATLNSTFQVQGVNGTNVGSFAGGGGTGSSIGVLIQAGTNSLDFGLNVTHAQSAASHFYVRGDGNIGIGTATPQTKLTIAGTGSANGITLGAGEAGTVNLYHSTASTLRTDDSFNIQRNATNAFVVQQAGDGDTLLSVDTINQRIGVNTAAPEELLHLSETSIDTIIRIDTLNVATAASSTAGPNSGATFVNDTSIGNISWNNPGNAVSSNNVYASREIDDQTTNYLKATNFSLSLPSCAEITGITVRIEKSSDDDGVSDNSVRIVKNDVITGSNKALPGEWNGGSDAISTYGSNSDLWGTTWGCGDISGSTTFGVAIAAEHNGTSDLAMIDHITIQVAYTTGATTDIKWAMGADNSDSGTFKLAATNDGSAPALGTNDLFTLTTAGNLSVTSGYSAAGLAGINVNCSSGQALNNIRITGGVVTRGTCTTNGFDLAENYPSNQALAPGEIVIFDTDAPTNYVKRSNQPYQKALVGVVSTQPGLLLGDPESGYPVALSGRVPVKVTDENGPIAVGDYLTTSSLPGHAMKATGSGAIIGTAMQAHTSGDGTIEVFVHTGSYTPSLTDELQSAVANSLQNGGEADLASLNVSGHTTLDTLSVAGDATFGGLATINKLVVTAEATFKGSFTVEGHIITAGETPAGQVLGASGNGAIVSIEGNDTAGTITVTTGASPAAGELADITFNKAFGKKPNISLTPTSVAAADAKYFYVSTPEGFKLNLSSVPQPNTIYTYSYFAIE